MKQTRRMTNIDTQLIREKYHAQIHVKLYETPSIVGMIYAIAQSVWLKHGLQVLPPSSKWSS